MRVVEDDPGVMVLAGVGVFAHVDPADATSQHQHGSEWSGHHHLGNALAGDPLHADQRRKLPPAMTSIVTARPPNARHRSGPPARTREDESSPPSVPGSGTTVIMVGGAVADGHPFGDVLAFGMTLCMAVMILIIRQHHETPMLPAAYISALLCPLLVWPLAAPFDVGTIDLLKLFLFGHNAVRPGARVPDRRRSNGLRHGERPDQHTGNATCGRMGVGLLQ
jgi:hypothetical protein